MMTAMNKHELLGKPDRSAIHFGRVSVKPGKFIFVSVCLLLTAAFSSAQNAAPPNSDLTKQSQRAIPRIPRDPTQKMEQSTNAEESDSPYFKARIRFLTLRRDLKQQKNFARANGNGLQTTAHSANLVHHQNTSEMPFWQGSFHFQGATFPFRMIGTNPANGSATTRIPVTIIPLQFTFGDGSQLSATQNACGDTESPVARILGSPLFQNSAFTVGGTFVGYTQYMDAFQRANFWSDVTTKSPDYHVLLSPSLNPLASIVPDPNFSSSTQGPCALVGFEDLGDFDQRVQNLIAELKIPENTLPVFVTYNTFLTENGGCCILGYHSVTFDTQRHPYVVASYSDPDLFTLPIEDIHALSHELGEWLNDPFIRSFVPSWGKVGQEGGCSFSLETGDAVTGTAFEITANGFTFHPEDLVFLSWFARETPSSSVNGQYTFLNSFSKPQGICGQ
jgi:hypothetical protein